MINIYIKLFVGILVSIFIGPFMGPLQILNLVIEDFRENKRIYNRDKN